MNNKVVYLEDIIEKFANGPSQLDKDQIIYLINRVPSFNRSFNRPKGKWTTVSHSTGGHVCSQCHWYASSYLNGDEYLSNFCPNCGADMRGEDKE